MTKVFEFLTKLVDNAHFGKIATDLSPGILLTMAAIILLSARTSLEIFPYDKIVEYDARLNSATALADGAEAAVDQARAALESLAREADAQGADSPFEVAEAHLNRLIEREELLRASVDTLAVERREAQTLKANLAVLSENFIELFIVGFIVGVLMAQVSGALLFNFVYHHLFQLLHKPKAPQVVADRSDWVEKRSNAFLALRVDATYAGRLPDIRSTHFRYVEVAMNMVLPTFGLAIAVFWLPGSVAQWVAVALLLVSIGLAYNGYQCFKGYRMQQWDQRAAMLAELDWLAPFHSG